MTSAVKAVPQQDPLAAAVELARTGRKQDARRLIREACQDDPQNAKAWLWSASLADTVPEALECLSRVLALEPANTRARDWYNRLRPTIVPVTLYYCFLCGHEAEHEFTRCSECGSLLSLDLALTLNGPKVDERKIRAGIERLKASEGAAESFDLQYFIAVGYLNLVDTYSALRHFRRAEQLDSRGFELRSIITRLGERPLIMAVDDCSTVRALISGTLERGGYRCLSVGSAVDALSYLEDESPKFVLLDVTMPYMDGYTLCRAIKGKPKTKHTAVVMLSGRDGFLDKVKGRMAGAADYLTKPFEPALLMRVIRKYVN